MKRRSSTLLTLCFVFIGVFSVHQIIFWRTSKSLSANSPTIKVKPHLETQAEGLLIRRPKLPIINCDRSQYRYDLCSFSGPTIMQPTTSTFLVVDPTNQSPSTTQKIRPYPRKWEEDLMSNIKELTISNTHDSSQYMCQFQHNAPALVFSTGGYIGNFWHDFTDSLLPLFVTIRSIFHRDPIFVIVNCHNWWLTKYNEILRCLTSYPIINLDNETAVHCFPSATLGLISHGDVSINTSLMPNSESLVDFHGLLTRSYTTIRGYQPPMTTRPQLLLVSREGNVGRVILNQADVIHVAKEIGFDVINFAPNKSTYLPEAYALIKQTHVLFGVHGAALTFSYFLRKGAIFIQVVPLGLDWVSENTFGEPARQLGLDYMLYKIKVEESSLVEKYGKDDLVLTNPSVVVKSSWYNTKHIYLQKQDVKLNLVRVKEYLEVAYEKAMTFMKNEKQG